MKRVVFPLCNGRPDRAPRIKGHTFFLCWRCTMVAVGALSSTIVLKYIKVDSSRYFLFIGLILLVPMIVDGVIQYFLYTESKNIRRAITGMLFGIGLSFVIYSLLDRKVDLLGNFNDMLEVIISTISLCINIWALRVGFKNNLKEKIIDRQREMYLKCYAELDRLREDQSLAFDKKYISEIETLNSSMKLFGSKRTCQCFATMTKDIQEIYVDYMKFQDTDPRENVKNYEIGIDRNGNVNQTYRGSIAEINNFEYDDNKYIEQHQPDKACVEKRLQELLDFMRADIGNDDYR